VTAGAFGQRPAGQFTITPAVKGAIMALAVGLSLFLAGGSAQAAGKSTNGLACDPANLLPGCKASSVASALDNITQTLAKPFLDIANFIGADAEGAITLSTVIPTLQDGHGQQCWISMKQFGDVIKAHPIPITFHVIQDYETLRLLGMATNNLCSNVHCTQVFSDATSMAQAASPVPLNLPSLHDLCTKVPQIAVVAPTTDAAPAK
jgi:hypothetical protein